MMTKTENTPRLRAGVTVLVPAYAGAGSRFEGVGHFAIG